MCVECGCVWSLCVSCGDRVVSGCGGVVAGVMVMSDRGWWRVDDCNCEGGGGH